MPPPWEENAYFFTPKTASVGLGLGVVSILEANPQRVGVIFGYGGTSFVNLGIDRATQLIRLEAGQRWYEVWQRFSGPLCTLEWFGVAGALAQTVSIVEIILSEWPAEIEVAGAQEQDHD